MDANPLLTTLVAYLIGAFPTGLLVARTFGIELAKHGSGNVGATNVARVVGKRAGVVTLAADCLKGAVATVIGSGQDDLGGAVAAVAAVCGHCFSLPLLKGGKGVATGFGALAALHRGVAATALGFFLMTFSLSRIVSLSSLVAAASAALIAWAIAPFSPLATAASFIGVIVWWRHVPNIRRLVAGEEPRFEISKQ